MDPRSAADHGASAATRAAQPPTHPGSAPQPAAGAAARPAQQQQHQQQQQQQLTQAEVVAKQSSQQENLLVMLWLYMNLFTDSYKALRDQNSYPALNQIVERLCKPYKLKHVAENWGVRQGYVEAKEGSKFLTEHPSLLRQFFSDNHGMFWITNSPAQVYGETYHRLRRWVLASKQVYQEELRALLYPVLVHFALELIQYDRGDGVKVAAAHKLVESAKDDHYHRHREHYLALRAICKPEHIQESSICREFLQGCDEKPTAANTVGLSPPTYRLLCSHVKEECRRFQLNVLMRVLFLRINIEIRGQAKTAIPSDLHTSPWTPDRYYQSVFLPSFRSSAASAADGGARGAGGGGGAGEALRFPALWDEVVEQKREAVAVAKAEAEKAAALAAAENSAEEEAKRKAEELEEDGQAAAKKPKKSKKKEEEEARRRRREEEEAKKAAKAKAPEPPKVPKVNTTSIPRPKMSDEQVDALAALYQHRAAVDTRVLPSVCFYTIENSRDGLNTASISANGKLLAAGMQDATVALWDVSNRLPAHQTAPVPTKRYGEATARMVTEEKDWEGGSVWCRPWDVMRGHTGSVYASAITHDDRFVATASEDGTVRLWCTLTRSYLLSFKGHNNPVWDVAWSPEGFYVATASYDGTARLWSIDHHYPLRMFVGHSADVDCVAFHPNCNYIATGGTDRTVRVWDAATGTLVRLMQGHVTGVTAVAFSPDGKRVVSGGESGEIMQWDFGQGRMMSNLVGHSDTVTGLDYSSGSSPLLVSSSVDCTVRLWAASGAGDVQYRDADKGAGEEKEGEAAEGEAGRRSGGAEVKEEKHEESSSSTITPVKTLHTKNTPVVAARFGLTNVVFAAGAPEAAS